MLKRPFIVKTHLQDISPALQECLKQIPFMDVSSIRPKPDLPGLSVSILVQGNPFTLLVRFQTSGQPRWARLAAFELKAAMSEMTDTYGVFSAPYISPQAADICRNAGIGYFDLAGNCYLSFGGVYIHKAGSANPFGEKRDLRSLYSPKAERVLRVLLTAPRQRWKTQELAQTAQVSLGQVANVKVRAEPVHAEGVVERRTGGYWQQRLIANSVASKCSPPWHSGFPRCPPMKLVSPATAVCIMAE